ncbi:hypothetical protein KBA73_01970 [Patescibacteria group bacterium]|nr:hypothetical protein [Patescibacteria group bacterium]
MHGDVFDNPLMTAKGHHPDEVILSVYQDTGHPELGVHVDNGTTSFFFYQKEAIEKTVLPSRDVLRMLERCGPFDLFFVVLPTKASGSTSLERKHYLNALALSRLREAFR